MEKVIKTIHKDVEALEEYLLKFPQSPAPTTHQFHDGLYIREITLPAGCIAIGHAHKFEQYNVMLKGRVTVLNDDGTTTELKAPMTFVGKPGRKVGFIHEETVWQNVFATEETDVGKLEEMLVEKSEAFMLNQKQKEKLRLVENNFVKEDYEAFLKEINMTQEQAEAQFKTTDDMRELPQGRYKFKLDSSSIHGKGIFATADLKAGELIAPARIKGKRTVVGRYTNHSPKPNAIMIGTEKGDMVLFADSDIKGSRGGDRGDEILVDYRQVRELNIEIAKGGVCQLPQS